MGQTRNSATSTVATSELKDATVIDLNEFHPSYIKPDDLEIPKKQINCGGGGSIYKGLWNKREVAIKKIDRYTSKEICEKEIKIMLELSKLQAPHVVQCHGFSFLSSPIIQYSIVMEYCAQSVDDYFSYKSPFDWSIRYEIVQQAINGLNWLHQHNIIHCDFKSGNVLLLQDPSTASEVNVKICDFGLSLSLNSNKKWPVSCGTSGWMAPEIMQGDYYTNKSDIYAFAVFMWELAKWSEPPYLSDVVLSRLLLQGYRDPIPSDCPTKINALITTCWQQDPAKRPTANEVENELSTDIDTLSANLTGHFQDQEGEKTNVTNVAMPAQASLASTTSLANGESDAVKDNPLDTILNTIEIVKTLPPTKKVTNTSSVVTEATTKKMKSKEKQSSAFCLLFTKSGKSDKQPDKPMAIPQRALENADKAKPKKKQLPWLCLSFTKSGKSNNYPDKQEPSVLPEKKAEKGVRLA